MILVERPLSSLATAIKMGPFGSSIKKERFVSEGVPVINGRHLHGVSLNEHVGFEFITELHADELRNANAYVGDVVITHRGTLGQASRIPDDARFGRYVISQSQLLVRCDPTQLDSRFLAYFLNSPTGRGRVLDFATQTGVPALAQPSRSVSQIRVPLLPVAEQQAIAEVLGALDDKIAANSALAATAEGYIRTAFAIALRSTGRTRALLDELVIEFGEPFSGGSFCDPGEGRPLIRIRDLKSFEPQVWTTEARPREAVVSPGDVLVGMDAEFRATPWLGASGVLNQRVLRASHPVYGQAMVWELLKRPLQEIEGEKSATTVIHLNKSDLARKTVTVPDEGAATAFEEIAEPLYRMRVTLAAENATLAATRDALLPQLMSGKLRVRDAEKIATEAGA